MVMSMARMVGMMGLALAVPVLNSMAVRAQEPEVGRGAYYGTYKYVSGQRGDESVPAERLVGTVVVKEGRIELKGPGGEVSFVFSYNVESTEGPIKLAMEVAESAFEEAVGATAKGLVGHEGGTVSLIYNYEGDSYPDDFTPDSDSEFLFVLERVAGVDIAGTYAYISAKQGNEDVPEEELSGSVRVTEDRFVLLDAEGVESFVMTYSVDEVGEVSKLSLTITKAVLEEAVGATAKGLVKLVDGELRLIYDYAPGAGYPGDFEPDSPTQNLFVLKAN